MCRDCGKWTPPKSSLKFHRGISVGDGGGGGGGGCGGGGGGGDVDDDDDDDDIACQ